jgi:hypothetical protein
MKAKIRQFYQEKIQPRLEALKAKALRLKQRVGAWLARHKRSLWLTVTVAATLVIITMIVAYLWQRSPTFRATTKGLTAAMAGMWALLRGNRPAEIPVPVVVTQSPRPPVEEEAFPVVAGPADDRL